MTYQDPPGGQEQREYYPYPPTPTTSERQGHSGVGIASSAVGLLNILGLFGLIVAVAVLEIRHPGFSDNDADPYSSILGLIVLLIVLLSLIGSVLGIIGLFEKQRIRLYAVLGTVFNGLLFLALGALMAVGAMG